MERGDVVTVAAPGDFGKPSPAAVIQSDLFDRTATATVLLMTSTLVDAPLIRLTVQPTGENGLSKPSQVQIDKAIAVRREKVGATIGRMDDEAMLAATRSLALFLGIA